MIRFEAGKEYRERSASDYTCILSFNVVRRTDKNVWISDRAFHKTTIRRRIHVSDGVEYIWPLGKYSMAPILRANRETSNMAVVG